MAVRTTKRRGKRVLVLDFTYLKPDGSKGRYRRDAEVQTRQAAHAEERRRLAAVAATGSPFEIVDKTVREQVAPAAPVKGPTLREVCEGYFKHFAPSHLKPGTAMNYKSVMQYSLLPLLGDKEVSTIDANLIREIDASLVRKGNKPATRRKVWTTLRSILCRYAVEAGILSEAPKMPKLLRKELTIFDVMSREDVDKLLAASCPAHQLAFLLAAYAGLRAGEVRGLRAQDVDLAAGRLIVRQSVTMGIRSTPKSGHQRMVPLAARLREALAAIDLGARGDAVARNALGQPWGDWCLRDAFKRAARRAGLARSWRFHDLRHFFVTELFRAGVSAPTIQKLAGHADLATTQRYAHVVQVDLDAAIGRLDAADSGGNSAVTGLRAA